MNHGDPSRPPSPFRLPRRVETALRHPATHVLLGLVLLVVDAVTPAYLVFPVALAVPVILAAWFGCEKTAYAMAVLLLLGRFCIEGYLQHLVPVPYAELNGVIQMVVLLALAYFVASSSRLTKRLETQVRHLESILPMCMGCHRIRNPQNEWESVEVYVTTHTDSVVSHGLCPDCAQRLYGSRASAPSPSSPLAPDTGG